MLWGQDRTSLRDMFISAWQDRQAGKPLDKQTLMVADVVAIHPEYHADLDSSATRHRDYDGSDGQSNPFLHMAMHIAVREQLDIDRPPGVVKIHQQLTRRFDDVHAAEHQMLECLAEVLWDAQQAGKEPDIDDYVQALKRVIKSA
jgi:hypothetical protein